MVHRESLGELLLRLNLVEPLELESALEAQKTSRSRLGELLVQAGALSDLELGWAIAQQCDIAFIPQIDTTPDHVDGAARDKLPMDLAFRLCAYPLLLNDEGLTVIMDDPHNALGIRAIERICRVDVQVVMGEGTNIYQALEKLYGKPTHAPSYTHGHSVHGWGFGPELRSELLADTSGESLLEWIIGHAREVGHRQIRFYPAFDGGFVLAGEGKKSPLRLSGEWYAQVLQGLKNMGRHMPVSFLRTAHGEAARARLLNESPVQIPELPVDFKSLQPGLILICHADARVRGAAVSQLAMKVAPSASEIVALGQAPAPKGAQHLALESPETIRRLHQFSPSVVIWESGHERALDDWLQLGRSGGWSFMSMATDDLVQAVANLRDRTLASGTLAASLSGIIELDAQGLNGALGVQIYEPDHFFRDAVAGWDVSELRRWRSLKLIALGQHEHYSKAG